MSGAIASQPTKEKITTAAARPTAVQPCGANGVQLLARADPAEPITATATITISTPTSTSWADVVVRAPPSPSASTTSSTAAATAVLVEQAAAGRAR